MGLLVKIDNKKDERFIAELLNKLGYSAQSVDIDELEDVAFGAIMKKNNHKDVLTLNEAKAAYRKMPKKK